MRGGAKSGGADIGPEGIGDRVVLVGGGGFARELYHWIADCTAAGRLPPLGGYVDDAGAVLRYPDRYDLPFLGGLDDCEIRPGDRFVLALGSPASKRAVHARLARRGARFGTVIHPSATVTSTSYVGEGSVVCLGCCVGPDSSLGRFVTLNSSSGTGHDTVVGDFSVLASAIVVAGNVQVGEDVSIGSSAVILPGLKVGAGAVIGSGSVVYRSVRPGVTIYAPPAKQLRLR